MVRCRTFFAATASPMVASISAYACQRKICRSVSSSTGTEEEDDDEDSVAALIILCAAVRDAASASVAAAAAAAAAEDDEDDEGDEDDDEDARTAAMPSTPKARMRSAAACTPKSQPPGPRPPRPVASSPRALGLA